MMEARIAHASAPRVDPANSAFRRPSAIGRIVRSTMLLSISPRPSVRNTVNPFQWLSVYLIAFARSDGGQLTACSAHAVPLLLILRGVAAQENGTALC